MNKRHYIAIFFIVTLLVSNLMATKIAQIGPFILPAAVILYPFCFMLGDVMTELGGFKFARKVIITGFGANLLMVVFLWLGQLLPPSASWEGQAAYELILGTVPRIALASFIAYLVGELLNSYVMVKIKERKASSPLFVRTILSTVVGQFFDTLIFITIAFIGTVPASVLGVMLVSQYVFKVVLEAVLGTPLAYLLIKIAKGDHQNIGG